MTNNKLSKIEIDNFCKANNINTKDIYDLIKITHLIEIKIKVSSQNESLDRLSILINRENSEKFIFSTIRTYHNLIRKYQNLKIEIELNFLNSGDLIDI